MIDKNIPYTQCINCGQDRPDSLCFECPYFSKEKFANCCERCMYCGCGECKECWRDK